MNERDLDRLLDAWLGRGPTVAPNRIIDAASQDIRAIRQATPMPRLLMSGAPLRLGMAAAVLIIAAALGYGILSQVGNPPAPIPSSSPSATPVPTLQGENLRAGRYRADPAMPVYVTVELPAGWRGDTWVAVGPNDNQAPDGMAIRFYAGDLNLYIDPLAPVDGILSPAVGPSVDDLVQAIVNHPDWNVTGDPTAITMDGYAGQLVQVTLPEDTSEGAPFYLFVDAGGGQIWGWAAGQVHDIHILDVDGERLVVEAYHYPGTSETDLAAQRTALDSIQIDPTP